MYVINGLRCSLPVPKFQSNFTAVFKATYYTYTLKMALLSPDTNSAFDSLLHRATAEKDEGIAAILKKDHRAQKAASEDYFRHWDDKTPQQETEVDRAERSDEYASLTRQYVLSNHSLPESI